MKKRNIVPLSRIFSLLKADILPALFSAVLSLASVLFSLRLPVQIGSAIDLLTGPASVETGSVKNILVYSVVCASCAAVFQYLSSLLSNRVAFSVSKRLRDSSFSHLQTLPLSELDRLKTGDLVSRITGDADSFADGMLIGTSQFISGAVTIAGTLISMLRINVPIALLVLLLTPVSFLVARYIASHTHDMFSAQTVSRGRESAFLEETLSGMTVLKSLRQESAREAEFTNLDLEYTANAKKATFYSSLTNPATRFVNAIIYASVACAGALLCLKGGTGLSVGALSALLSYASSYGKPFNEISSVLAELQNAFVCAGRLLELEDLPSEPSEEGMSGLYVTDGEVAAEGVYFSYDKSRPLIQDLSFHAHSGQKIAIVGPTGCGKTTVINLLMRFYEPDRGRIFIDGSPADEVTRKSVRRSYGMVLQDTWLKTGTIRDNIAFGRESVTEDEIVAAAKAARADSFIRRLPAGYDTLVSDEDGTLSAGQKQLLCLARVMLRTPDMLILDEATSSIDTRTELMVQRSFDELMEGRTCFIVAHRLSTIRSADLILVMKEGVIAERGTHEQLLAQGELYSELYRSQFETQC